MKTTRNRAMLPVISAVLGAVSVLLGTPARAADAPITLSCTATADCQSAFVAADQGIFARHGLNVTVTPIALNSNIPAALQSDSIQIGGPTSPVFLQALDGGLDLVALAGASVTNKKPDNDVAVVARNGAPIHTAQDFIGKRIGVPGIGAFLDVLFRQWLIQNHVDPAKCIFVEVTFPNMADTLRSGAVDAVVSAGPFLSRIQQTNAGTIVARYLLDLPDNEPIIFYAATRAWAAKHADDVAKFRAAIAEASVYADAHPDETRAAIAKFTKLPIAVLNKMEISDSQAGLSAAQLQWWVGVMEQQHMLQSKIDPAKAIFP